MNILVYLIPASLLLGGLGLALFFWTLRSNQYDDPQGNAHRILSDRWDDEPPEEKAPEDAPPEDIPPSDIPPGDKPDK